MAEAVILPFPETMWLGTEQSLEVARAAYAAVAAGSFGQVTADAPAEPDMPYLVQMQGDIAVINITGSLTGRDNAYLRYYGMTTYPDIQRALVWAASNQNVKAILLNIESGGGAVAGVDDTAKLIADINKGLKPVYSFTSGAMASAAYWLGSSAKEVYTSRTAMMGSIGVIATLVEQSKAMADAGYGVKVVRAGKFKALANPYEPLSKAAEDQIQAQLDAVYTVFLGHVAEMRKVSTEVADKTMAQGREFIGEEAVTAGLANAVITYSDLIAKIEAKILDTNRKKEQTALNFQRGVSMKSTLTPEQIAALAAGATAEAAAAAAAAGEKTEEQKAAEVKAAEEAADAEAAAKAAAEAAAKPAAGNDAVVALLKDQLRDAQASVTTLTLKNAELEAKVKTSDTVLPALLKIAGTSLSNMKVALGFTAVDASKMSPEALLAEHSATSETFASKFKVGGVAAAPAPQDKGADKTVTNLRAAVLANRPTK